MSSRDPLFPSASIGRGQGLHIQRIPSHESLTAHPLLSPNSPKHHSPSPSSSSLELPAGGQLSNTAPRYVPYTPRQRVAPTSATTGATMHPVPPQQPSQGGATTKLQLMNLKAAAQNIGLDGVSVGWAILEKLESLNDGDTEWNEIWSAVSTGKATLLLPLEQTSNHDPITVDLIKDHIVLCEGPSRNDAPIVFLSGLRGTLTDETLTIRSSLTPTSQPFQSILDPSSRSSALSSLPPLPAFPSSPSIFYPSFSVPSYAPALPIPPRAAAPSKPALPPRPGARTVSGAATSRLSIPFASLFGKTTAPSPTSVIPPAAESEHVIEVPTFTIDRRIDRKDLGRALTKAVKSEVEETLAVANAPGWVTTRVHNFTAEWYPLTKSTRKSATIPSPNTSTTSLPYLVSGGKEGETPEDIAARLQDFYDALEEDLRAMGRKKADKEREAGGEEDENEKEKGKGLNEARRREIMEAVERTICEVFYDRLFRQPNSDDAQHDEALSSRIAALNMLDLGLEHLGVDAGGGSADVHVIVKACGETLSGLELSGCRSPANKAAVLVAAHKMVVDGLSRLPPIHLKSEEEIEDQKTPRVSTFGHQRTADDEDEEEEEDEDDVLKFSTTSTVTTAVEPPTSSASTAVDSTSSQLVPSPEPVPTVEFPAEDGAADSAKSATLAEPPASPILTISPPPEAEKPTPVSGDVLLPLIIYAVVKANPPRLVSHLLYTQRFRNHSVGGEESYCLINLMAVAEFLENVDLGALGLKEDEKKVLSAADLKPIPVARDALGNSPTLPQQQLGANLRGRVEQQVDAITGSANRMLSGVVNSVDTSFGVLRSLLPGGSEQPLPSPTNSLQEAAPWNRPGFGLLRRESGFSIASLAASLPRSRARSVTSPDEEKGQQMVEVSSRPGSVRSLYVNDDGSESGTSETGTDDESEGEGEEELEVEHDTRSIRSFESMMSERRKKAQPGRRSLADRLAQVPGLSRLGHAGEAESSSLASKAKTSPPPSRRSSLLPSAPTRFDTPVSSRPTSPGPGPGRLAPPKQRFMECAEDDLKLSEVAELLRDYRRLVEGIRAMGGFE
ncbi:hypothetical protein NEOLEDRAFT_1162873 [Neolentinus lepideus HHB14362 ss-1]|uniref:VPS9 domain-containing protein n=1 Tax=Neolentinus lepideus HHB14362 ss-1 TaxID=1314782 RepID=A0A165SI07_9AGAM|nr:hypothetical protein NEOLEDRAFT_1162873 [Neolentinus lepideus HHB14362 ss-1]